MSQTREIASRVVEHDRGMIQESQYDFPYHHLPHFDSEGVPAITRSLTWGYEYLCYLQHLADSIRELRPASVIDVGCGDGALLGLLANSGIQITGVEKSTRAIAFARAFYPELDFRCLDAQELHETFDVVVASEVLEHVPDNQVSSFIQMLGGLVNPFGHVIITVPTRNVPLNPKHYRHYDEELIMQTIHESGSSLKVIDVYYVFKRTVVYNLLRRLSCNSHWSINSAIARRFVWRYVWNRARHASAHDGCHMVVYLRPEGN